MCLRVGGVLAAGWCRGASPEGDASPSSRRRRLALSGIGHCRFVRGAAIGGSIPQSLPDSGGALSCDGAPQPTRTPAPLATTRVGDADRRLCDPLVRGTWGLHSCAAQGRPRAEGRAPCSSRVTSALASLPIQALPLDWLLSASALCAHSPASAVTGVSLGRSTSE